eukprot:gb/GFBE01058408.1/.p1 GENE.gb/GFBE01058408.1/~~gb/GFBE01058408.1/.p1  ORF type:complete len:661 (+),score=153.44 gb/GFBE01058408.1/:1-1983(+)
MTADKDKPFAGKRAKRMPKVGAQEDKTSSLAAKRKWAQETVTSVRFDIAMGVIILTSAICIGLEQAWSLEGKSTVFFQILESFFLVIYILEFSLRWFAHGRACLNDSWTRFDLFLIMTGVLTFWILEPIFVYQNAPEMVNKFAPLMMLRALRLFRLAKIARLFSRIREFWLLIRGLMTCAPLVLYTFIIFLFCLYGFACVAVELIAKHPLVEEDEEFRHDALKYFGSLTKALLTLLRYACLDNMSEVHELLVEKDPMLGIYFVILTFVVSLVLFHLLGAVIFASTLDQNQQEMDGYKTEQAETWTKLISGLRELFFRLDEDMSGQLSKEELMNIDPVDMKELTDALGGSPMSASQVFDALDVDGSGEISIDEFFDGIRDVVLDRSHLGHKRLEKQVETIHWRLKEMFSAQYEMKVQLARIFGERDLQSPRLGGRRPNMGEVPKLGSSTLRMQESDLLARRSKVAAPATPKKEMNGQTHQPRNGLLSKPLLEEVPAWATDLTDKLQQSWEESLKKVTEVVNEAAKSGKQEVPVPKQIIRRTVIQNSADRERSNGSKTRSRSSSKESTGSGSRGKSSRSSIRVNDKVDTVLDKSYNSSDSLRAQSTSLPESATPPEPPSVIMSELAGDGPENPKGSSAALFPKMFPGSGAVSGDGHPSIQEL